MKTKIIAILMAGMVAMAIGVPMVIAGIEEDVTISATVGIMPPEVVCKCETPDEDLVELGTQVNPNLWPITKTVMKCAIVCDPNGMGDIKYVNATTYYPAGTIKEEQTMHVANESEKDVCCCNTDGLPNETCQVYAGYITMEACDPAGNYTVNVTAEDMDGLTDSLENKFKYLSIIGLDLDLVSVSFGALAPDQHKWVLGDDVWGGPNLTVRSIGNDPIDIEVTSPSGGLNCTTPDTCDAFNIPAGNIDCTISGCGPLWLPSCHDVSLGCCDLDNVNLSLKVDQGTPPGSYSGTALFTAVANGTCPACP